MTVRPRWALVVATLVLSSCQSHFVGGWMPWWQSSTDRAAELNTLTSAAPLVSEISPFWYAAHADGSVNLLSSGATLDATVASLRSRGFSVIPSVVDGTGKLEMATLLADPVRRASHVQQLVNLAVAKGYDGIDLDYEVFAFTDGRATWPTTQPNWVAFVNQLAASLHASGKLLSVTVPPVWTTVTPSGTITNGYTVYAQGQIAAAVDRLRLMVYDWSVGSAGPISPMFWVSSVIAYSSSVVPVAKLQLGVPAYGRHWARQKNSSELCPDGATFTDSITMEEAPGVAAAHGLTPRLDSNGWGEMTFSWEQVVTGPRTPPIIPVYTPPAIRVGAVNGTTDPIATHAVRLTPPSNFVTCTLTHVVYYPDANSVRQRADAAMGAGWRGIFIWALGYENANVFPALSNIP